MTVAQFREVALTPRSLPTGEARPELRARHAGGMPGVELAAVRRQTFPAPGEGGELLDERAARLGGEERHLVALRIERDVAEWVPLHDRRQLSACAHDHVDLEPGACEDELPADLRHRRRMQRGREDDVPALHIGAHVVESGVLEVCSQLRHCDPVLRADVDAAQKDDLAAHRLNRSSASCTARARAGSTGPGS